MIGVNSLRYVPQLVLELQQDSSMNGVYTVIRVLTINSYVLYSVFYLLAQFQARTIKIESRFRSTARRSQP